MNHHTTKTTKNKIFVSGRCVGKVENNVFKKSIKGSRHILHTPRAIALSVESLRKAEQLNAGGIEIYDLESGQIYSCTLDSFKRHSFPLQRGGFEPQLALPIGKFNVTAPLEYSSRALKSGEVKHTRGNGKRVRHPRGLRLESPRQLLFKGMG